MMEPAVMAARFRTLLPPPSAKPAAVERRGKGFRGGLDGLRSPVMNDKARIITSAVFRRLQTKAQVFSLERDASVRTRLTHSLEVAMYGELLAERVFNLLREQNRIDEDLRIPFIGTVENACLLHDIGNPPFGHLGEFAIQQWFKAKAHETFVFEKWSKAPEEAERYYVSFKEFNGNAQSFRIVTRLQWLDGPHGMRLTWGLLGTMIKYLTCAAPSRGPFKRKLGYFETEAEVIAKAWDKLGLKHDDGVPLQRHPLTYLMEAADDIAYALSDIEDALEKRILTEQVFIERFKKVIEPVLRKYAVSPDERAIPPRHADDVKYSRFLRLRSLVTNALIDASARAFVDNVDAILIGDWHKELLAADTCVDRLVKRLKELAKRDIFLSAEAVDVELSGYQIVQELLNGFMPLLRLEYRDMSRLETTGTYHRTDWPLERRLYSLLGQRQLKAYHHFSRLRPELDRVYRTHLIVDFVSGMTDGYAVKIFNIMNGVSVGSSL
jgi:dGTPase